MAYGNKASAQWIISGVTDLRRFLLDLKPSTQMAIIATSVESASKPIVQQAKANVSIKTGALRKSLGAIVRRYPRTGSVVAFIGARRGSYAVATDIKSKRTGAMKLRDNEDSTRRITPANYSHLVEYGHRSVHGGGALPNFGEKVKGVWNAKNKGKSIRNSTLRATSFVAPRPFLMPAFQNGKAFAEQRIIEGFNKAVEREFKKAQRKHNKTIKLAA